MADAGATDPRNGRPSWRALSQMSGVAATTIIGMAFGDRKSSASTIAKVAEALNISPTTLSGWLPSERRVGDAWTAPDEVRFLTTRQLRALDEFIRATADAMGGGDGDEGDTTPITAAPSVKQRRELQQELLQEASWHESDDQ